MLKWMFLFDPAEPEFGLRERRLVFETATENKTETQPDDPETPEKKGEEGVNTKRLEEVENNFLAETEITSENVPLAKLELVEETKNKIKKVFGSERADIWEKSKDEVLRELIKERIKKERGDENYKDIGKRWAKKIKRPFTSEAEERFQKEKTLKASGADYSTEEYKKATTEQQTAIHKLTVYSPKYLEGKFGENLEKPYLEGTSTTESLPLPAKAFLSPLLDWSDFVDQFQDGDPAARVLLANLLSRENRGWLTEIQNESDNELTREEDKITGNDGLDAKQKTVYKEHAEAQKDVIDAKKDKEIAEMKLKAKEELERLYRERKPLLVKRTRTQGRIDGDNGAAVILKNASSSLSAPDVDTKSRPSLQDAYSRAEEKFNTLQDNLADQDTVIDANSNAILKYANLFGTKYSEDNIDKTVEADLRSEALFGKQSLAAKDLDAGNELAKTKSKLEFAEAQKEDIDTKHKEQMTTVNKIKKTKNAEVIGKTKMSPKDVLIAMKTKAFEKSLEKDGVSEADQHEKAKSMATAAVANEIGKVENNSYATKLEKQAAEAMEQRLWKNNWAGKTLGAVSRGFNFVDGADNKEKGRRSVRAGKWGYGLLKNTLKDIFLVDEITGKKR